MPDGDIIDRRVKRGWQTASRRMIGAGEGPDAVPAVLRALAKEIKADGCPGLDEVVGILVAAKGSLEPRAARSTAHEQLDRIGLRYGNRATKQAIKSAGHVLAVWANPDDAATWEMDDGELRVHIACVVLADIADAQMCPAVALHELVEGGNASFQEVDSRRQQSKELIVAAPETRRMAVQLLADPSGSSVKTPRFHGEKPSQAEILVTPLTS